MMNQDHFDWAALAQQWIQKNSCSIHNNSSDIPEPPPPPIISSNVAQHLSKKYEEQGEADMEVVKDDDEHIQMHQQQQPNFMQINDGFSSGPTIVQQQVWFGPPQNQQIPYCNPWNHWQGPGNVVLPPPQLHIPPVTQINIIRDQVLPIPPLIKSDIGQQIVDTTPVIDAAKRKTLPAWIREGLEKMEREKLKQMEKLKTSSDNINTNKKSQWSDDDDDDNNNTNCIINTKLNDDDPIIGSKPIKSSFDLKNIVKSSPANSDSENSADEDIRSNNNFPQQLENKKSSPELQLKKSIKSYDEIVEELMLVVRRSLTEILLEVTTEEIVNISQETYKKYKLKASSAQVFRKSALSSITGKLGLGAYADSASSDENISDSSDDENGKNSDQENDSEAELRENIRNRQNAFKIIAQEIDSLVSQEEARNEKTKERRSTERSYSSTKGLYSGTGNSSGGVGNNISTLSSSVSRYGGDKEFGETQHTDKKSLSNGKRPKERTSRFSDNKDSRHKSASSSSHYLVPTTASIQTAPPAPTFLITSQLKSSSTTTELDDKSYSSTSRKYRRGSNSSSNESKSSSRRSSSYRRRHRYDSEHSTGTSSRHNKNTSKDDDKYSSSRYKKHDNSNDSSSSRKGRRRRQNHEDNSSDSDDYHHSHRKNSNSNSEIIKSARKIRSRSRSKSKTTSIRSRSRSRSRSSYSSSRRYDRY